MARSPPHTHARNRFRSSSPTDPSFPSSLQTERQLLLPQPSSKTVPSFPISLIQNRLKASSRSLGRNEMKNQLRCCKIPLATLIRVYRINVEEDNKILEVLQEYSEIRKEIYTRRNKVLLSIEDFWFLVFLNHPVLGEFLNVEDRKILRYLVSLDVEERPKLGYSITFNFSPNPYFEDNKLTKTYSFPDEATAVVSGATIKWKEGLHKGLEDTSFFMWLSETQQMPAPVAVLDEIAYTIKGCVWPDPLRYIIDDESLDGGGMQKVDEEGGEINVDEGGQLDEELEKEDDEEDKKSYAEESERDDEIEEGDEEGVKIDAQEGWLDDDGIEEQVGDEENGEIYAEEDWLDDDEIEQNRDEEGEEIDDKQLWVYNEPEEQEGDEKDEEFYFGEYGIYAYDIEGREEDEEEQEGDEEDEELDAEEGVIDDDEIEEQEEDEEDEEIDVEEEGLNDNEIKERHFDAKEDGLDDDDEIEVQEGDQEGEKFDAEEGGIDDNEIEDQEDEEDDQDDL